MNSYFGRTCLALTAFLLLAFSIGCRKDDFTLIYSHQLHVVENEIECSTCHQTTAAGDMSLPGHDVCSNCHEIDEANPSAACLQCHKAKSPSEIEVRYPEKIEKEEIIFSHEKHDYMGATCETCHIKIPKAASIKQAKLPPLEACLGCHNDKTAPLADCSVCHVESSPVNATHKLNWQLDHGIESKFGSSKCFVCHREDTCISCHQDTKPRDHNNTWRKITHGAEAAWNRSRCMVCHQEDFCERCHEEAEPLSHRGGWVSGPTRHCFQCHFPISAVNCSVCHKSAPHPTAPASPHPPFVGFVCEECHPTPAGIFPPHPDPGVECTICHER